MSDIFISYRRSDANIVSELTSKLSSVGASVWYDSALGAGRKYRNQIQDELDQSSVVVVLWTPQSVRSPWVKAEALRGLERGRLVSICAAGTRIDKAFSPTIVAEFTLPKPSESELALIVRALWTALEDVRSSEGQGSLTRWRPAGRLVDFSLTFLLLFGLFLGIAMVSQDFWTQGASEKGNPVTLMTSGLWGLALAMIAMIFTPLSILFAFMGEFVGRYFLRINIASRSRRLAARWAGEALGWLMPFIVAVFLAPAGQWDKYNVYGPFGAISVLVLTLAFIFFGSFLLLAPKYIPLMASKRMKRLILQ
jgi:TIR domain